MVKGATNVSLLKFAVMLEMMMTIKDLKYLEKSKGLDKQKDLIAVNLKKNAADFSRVLIWYVNWAKEGHYK